MPTRMECPTCGFKWSRPDSEPPTKPCPKCQTPLKLKNTTRKTTTELIAEEKKARGGSRRTTGNKDDADKIAERLAKVKVTKTVNPNARSATGKAKKATPMECDTCGFKWKRPAGEPDWKPCPKCQTPLNKKKSTRKTTTEYIAEEKASRRRSGR